MLLHGESNVYILDIYLCTEILRHLVLPLEDSVLLTRLVRIKRVIFGDFFVHFIHFFCILNCLNF